MTAEERSIAGLDLDDDRYTVEQSLVRNKYAAYDAAGEPVLRGKQKLFRLREEFPFVGPDGEELFTVEAGGVLDVAGNYTLYDRAGEPVVILDNDFSLLQDTWRVRDPDTEAVLARIDSRGAAVTLARNLIPLVGPLIPYEYEITDADGAHVGRIEGQLSVQDRYEVTLTDADTVPRDAVLAAAMVIDAIQGN